MSGSLTTNASVVMVESKNIWSDSSLRLKNLQMISIFLIFVWSVEGVRHGDHLLVSSVHWPRPRVSPSCPRSEQWRRVRSAALLVTSDHWSGGDHLADWGPEISQTSLRHRDLNTGNNDLAIKWRPQKLYSWMRTWSWEKPFIYIYWLNSGLGLIHHTNPESIFMFSLKFSESLWPDCVSGDSDSSDHHHAGTAAGRGHPRPPHRRLGPLHHRQGAVWKVNVLYHARSSLREWRRGFKFYSKEKRYGWWDV